MDENYFTNALNFFNETKWLYDTPVVDILVENSLEKIPKQWTSVLKPCHLENLNNLVGKNMTKCDWPNSLLEFNKKCKHLNDLPLTSIELKNYVKEIPKSFFKGMNPKKQHEIIRLAELIHLECSSLGVIDIIIDLGAGLGYVCQLLDYLYDYKVLGLEGNQSNVDNVKQKQLKNYPDSLNNVKYIYCRIDDKSVENIQSILKTEYPNIENVCLIGLHTCGDLGVNAMNIYRDMKLAKLFILVPCCYHKLNLIQLESRKQYFNNFPLSRCLRNTIEQSGLDVGNFLRIPFLRLASQESTERWIDMSFEDHEKHSFYVLARAVVQLYVKQNGLHLDKLVNKTIRKSQGENFDNFLSQFLIRYHLKTNDLDIVKSEIMKLWNEWKDKLWLVEVYTGLQLMLQGPAEFLILNDRLCWLREHNLITSIQSVMDKKLSPRSYAIVSHKPINK